MAALYPGTSVTGYNANPPPDDGTTVSTNQITWNSTIKAKLGDPLNTFATNVDSNITTGFGRTLDGATVVSTGVNYNATGSDQGRLIKATASAITITTPDATVVTAPFVFAVNNQSAGTITLAGGGSGPQTVDGATTQVIQSGGSCLVKTDGSNWFTVGLKPGANVLGGNNYGFTDVVNANLLCSVGSNLLTVALKNKAGNDPSASDPVIIPFRDNTLANGDPVFVNVTSALSINTNAVGATLGTRNGVPFKFWVVIFNNGGTPVLGLWNSGASLASPAISPLAEWQAQSATGISAGATSAGTFYCPNGTTVTTRPFRILGYLEYGASAPATAGTYTAVPDQVQLFGPGIKKPGDEIQRAYGTVTSSATTTSTSFTTTGTNLSATIAPSAPTNLVEVHIATNVSNNTGSDGGAIAVFRGASTLVGVGNGMVLGTSTGAVNAFALDYPVTTSNTTYNVAMRAITGGTATFHSNAGASSGGSILVKEIMG